MEVDVVLRNLCYYDVRNPERYDGLDGDEIDFKNRTTETKKRCCCDNCFYGRDRLASYILELLDHSQL